MMLIRTKFTRRSAFMIISPGVVTDYWHSAWCNAVYMHADVATCAGLGPPMQALDQGCRHWIRVIHAGTGSGSPMQALDQGYPCRHWIRVIHAGTGSGPDFTYTGSSETHRIKATAILNQGHTRSGPCTQAA
jgi:hypothetical protein